ncbi:MULTISPECIES: hypothetical protein [Bacillus]|uniref:hypothetical protein n=1 Tax=Bacillus TaxID=1386 RepID=UPI002115F810|nr:hypothetical protein [Bacillus altitudinis]
MDKLSSIILAAWLRVPRWFKQGVLVSITIFFFYMCFVKGLTSWYNLAACYFARMRHLFLFHLDGVAKQSKKQVKRRIS